MPESVERAVNWPALQDAFAHGAPVLVLGPGCHRIGFDETTEWSTVRARAAAVRIALIDSPAAQEFLDRLWIDQLSETTRSQHFASIRTRGADKNAMPLKHDIRRGASEVRPKEHARIALAADVLRALTACTRCLGAEVEAGGVPVTDWQRLTYGSARLAEDAGPMQEEARGALECAAELADAIFKACEQGAGEGTQRQVIEGRGLRFDDATRDQWGLLKLREIRDSLLGFRDSRFASDRYRISGANVEWLADLFWHLIVAGSEVPPSQDEVDFYVNLHGGLSTSERRFSRPHPGEYRGPTDGWKTLTEDIENLLGSYDSGVQPSGRDWRRPRERFALTMAASLAEAWRREPHDEAPRLALALVSDYDLMLEQALMRVLEEGEGFHVLLPVAVALKGSVSLTWAYGTYVIGDDVTRRRVDAPVSWQTFEHAPSLAADAPRGPLVVKLAGSPYHREPSASDLGVAPDAEITCVALFSEHDSVRAVIEFLPQAGAQAGGLQANVLGEEGMTWDGRSWLFFGHRFSDWLPRLQLLFTALMLARSRRDGTSAPLTPRRATKHRIAVDYSFDWPEQALLDALVIERRHADLRDVAKYFEKPMGVGLKKDERQALKDFHDAISDAIGQEDDEDER